MTRTRKLVEQYKQKDSLAARIQSRGQVMLAGESMLPLLNPEKTPLLFVRVWERYRVGDVVVFEYPQSLAGVSVHRIVKIKGTKMITKGDNNLLWDEAVPLTAAVARVEKALDRNGKFSPVKACPSIALLSALEGRAMGILPKKWVANRLHPLLKKLYCRLGR